VIQAEYRTITSPIGETVYFILDREDVANVWSFNTAKGKLAQVNTQEMRGCPAARLTEPRAPRLHSGFGSLFVQ